MKKIGLFIVIIEVSYTLLLFASCTSSTSGAGQYPSIVGADSIKQLTAIKRSKKELRKDDSLQLLNLLKMNYNELKILNLSTTKTLPPLFSIGAKNMILFHQKAVTDLATIIHEKNIRIKTQPDNITISACYKLSKEEGTGFEDDFFDCVIKTHKEAISQCQAYYKSNVDSEVATWCASAIPIMQSHLQMTENAQKDINSKTNTQAYAF